ncbi:MAG: flagellar biosynthetic protein FliO [Pseudomonadales bacterium]
MNEFPQASQLGNLVISLILVVALIFACIWVIKRLSNLNQAAGNHLNTIASLSLGTRERIVLVQVGDQQVLIGVAPGRVSKLQTFSEPVIDVNSLASSKNDFSSQLANFLPGAR